MTLFHIHQLLAIGLVCIQSLAAFSQMTSHDPIQDQVQAIFLPPPESASESFPASNATRSFWLNAAPGVNPFARAGSTGPLTADADICIIGSGMTGVSVAYHLSKLLGDNTTLQDPLSVVILEARDFCWHSFHLFSPEHYSNNYIWCRFRGDRCLLSSKNCSP